jgi:DUF1009 family protein
MAAQCLGIVAGSGALPGLVERAHRAAGGHTHVLAILGSAEPEFLDRPPEAWIGLAEPNRAFELFRAAGVTRLIFVGGIRRIALSTLKPDIRAAAFLARVAIWALGDDTLLRAVAREVEAEGFEIVGVKDVAPGLLAPLGPLGRLSLSPDRATDVTVGLAAARDHGRADRGQAVVVRGGAVVAVEDEHGTDALIARAGRDGVLVKCRKPQQDVRFDLPAIGPATITACAKAGLIGIAIEAGETIVIDPAVVAAAADAAGIFIVGVTR